MLRRLGRILRTLLAGTLVLVWLLFIALWIRSHWRADQLVVELQRPTTQPAPLRNMIRTREWIAMAGDGGICLATRVQETLSWGAKSHLTTRAESTPSPSYPQPWATAIVTTIRISSGGTLMTGGGKVTAFPTTAVFSLTAPPATGPSASGISSSSFTLSSIGMGSVSAVSVASPSGRGSLQLGGGNVVVNGANTTVTGSTLSLSGVVRMFTPLPAPKNWPAKTYQFIAYHAGEASEPLGQAHVLIVPFWFAGIFMTLLMLLGLRSERNARTRRWRARNGCCVACGYDLRASGDRCPECGADNPHAALASITKADG